MEKESAVRTCLRAPTSLPPSPHMSTYASPASPPVRTQIHTNIHTTKKVHTNSNEYNLNKRNAWKIK